MPAAQPCTNDEEWFLPTADSAGHLYVREFGAGEPIVVLHGGFAAGQHVSLLDPLRYLGARYRLVFYDQRGALRSPVPPESYSLAGHLSDLEQLRAELCVQKLDLIGHSAGGDIAMAYLDRFPDRVGGLILLGASPPPQSANHRPDAVLQFVHRSAVDAELKAHGLDGDETNLTARERTMLWRIRFAAANCYYVDRWREMPAGGIYFGGSKPPPLLIDAPESWDYADALAGRREPTHVIIGDHDKVDMGAAGWAAHAREVATLQLAVITEAGHFSWVDQPERFRDAVDAALG